MKGNERGNAMLISAILVFGLTVTALGVSRLLVKGTQGMVAQREFLGVQAHQLCDAGVQAWLADTTPRPFNKLYFFGVSRAGKPPTTMVATVSVFSSAMPTPGWFMIQATASLSGVVDPGVAVSREVFATASCQPACGTPEFIRYFGGP